MTPAIDDSNLIIEEQLGQRLEAIEAAGSADAVTYVGPIVSWVADTIKIAIEDRPSHREKLLVILETYGGYIEIAERIAHTFRHHYRVVDFIVPNFESVAAPAPPA